MLIASRRFCCWFFGIFLHRQLHHLQKLIFLLVKICINIVRNIDLTNNQFLKPHMAKENTLKYSYNGRNCLICPQSIPLPSPHTHAAVAWHPGKFSVITLGRIWEIIFPGWYWTLYHRGSWCCPLISKKGWTLNGYCHILHFMNFWHFLHSMMWN